MSTQILRPTKFVEYLQQGIIIWYWVYVDRYDNLDINAQYNINVTNIEVIRKDLKCNQRRSQYILGLIWIWRQSTSSKQIHSRELSFLLQYVVYICQMAICKHDLNPFHIITDIPFINPSSQLSSNTMRCSSRLNF